MSHVILRRSGSHKSTCLTWSRVTVLIPVLLAFPYSKTQAQTDRVVSGSRVKLDVMTMPPGVQLVGRIVVVGSDTIVVAVEPNSATPGDSTTLVLALNLISGMQISQGSGRANKAGLAVGAFTGFLGGGVYGFATASDICSSIDNILFPDECESQGSRMAKGAGFAALGLVVGGALGYFIGSAIPKERWQRVVVRGMRVSTASVVSERFFVGAKFKF